MKKWEYKTVYFIILNGDKLEATIDETLNKYGVDGWELVNCTASEDEGLAFFKREL